MPYLWTLQYVLGGNPTLQRSRVHQKNLRHRTTGLQRKTTPRYMTAKLTSRHSVAKRCCAVSRTESTVTVIHSICVLSTHVHTCEPAPSVVQNSFLARPAFVTKQFKNRKQNTGTGAATTVVFFTLHLRTHLCGGHLQQRHYGSGGRGRRRRRRAHRRCGRSCRHCNQSPFVSETHLLMADHKKFSTDRP